MRMCGARPLERPAVREHEIENAVVVEVEEADAGAGGFEDVLIGGGAAEDRAVGEAGAGRDVHERRSGGHEEKQPRSHEDTKKDQLCVLLRDFESSWLHPTGGLVQKVNRPPILNTRGPRMSVGLLKSVPLFGLRLVTVLTLKRLKKSAN